MSNELMAELAEVVKQMGFDLPQCYARDAAYAFIKAHHAELEAVVKDAARYQFVRDKSRLEDELEDSKAEVRSLESRVDSLVNEIASLEHQLSQAGAA